MAVLSLMLVEQHGAAGRSNSPRMRSYWIAAPIVFSGQSRELLDAPQRLDALMGVAARAAQIGGKMGEAKKGAAARGVSEGRTPAFRGQIPQPGTFRIENPLVIMFADERGEVVLPPAPVRTLSHSRDLRPCWLPIWVRHVRARAFDVGEEDVWEWVDKRAPPSHNEDHQPILRQWTREHPTAA